MSSGFSEDKSQIPKEIHKEEWLTSWELGYWDHEVTQPDRNLERHFEVVTEGKQGLKVLMPLCATSYDVIWLLEKGHNVVCVDLSPIAAERLFKTYRQEPVIEDVKETKGKLYKNSDGSFRFHVCDMFAFNEKVEGTFDFIWDSGAMCAVNESDRPQYLSLMRSLMHPGCLLMLQFPKHNTGERPYSFTEQQINEYYGDICDVELLDEHTVSKLETRHLPLTEQIRQKQASSSHQSSSDTDFVLICYKVKKRH